MKDQKKPEHRTAVPRLEIADHEALNQAAVLGESS